MEDHGGLPHAAHEHQRDDDAQQPEVARAVEADRPLERVRDELKSAGVWLAPYKELDAQQSAWVREYYVRNIFPLVTPQAMDPAQRFASSGHGLYRLPVRSPAST